MFQMIQWVKSRMGWVRSSSVTARVAALGDRFQSRNSGERSYPRAVFSMGMIPPSSMPTQSKSR